MKIFDDNGNKALALLHEFTLLLEIQPLVQEAQATKCEHLILVQAERKRHASFFEELYDLDNMLAGIGEGNDGRRRFGT